MLKAALLKTCLCLSATVALALYLPARNRIFVDPDNTFQFAVPLDYSLYTGKDLDKANSSYIAVCQDDLVACAVYAGNAYKGTNFGGAAFEVRIIPSAESSEACLTFPNKGTAHPTNLLASRVSPNNSQKNIHGIRFVHRSDGGAAAGHEIERNLYRGFVNGRCYELATAVTYSGFLNYDHGTIREFKNEEKHHLQANLLAIVDSFQILK